MTGNRRLWVRKTLWLILLGLALSQAAIGQRFAPVFDGTFPLDGGPITVTTTNGPVSTLGFTFRRMAGAISAGDSPAPFDQFSRRTADSVSLQNYGSENILRLDGSFTLDVNASADARLQGLWVKSTGRTSTESWEFPTIGGEEARNGIEVSYPYDGGPITIAPRLASVPVRTSGLEILSDRSSLTSSGNGSPFSSVETSQPTQWKATSANEIVVDRPIALGLIQTDPEAKLTATHLTSAGIGNLNVVRQEPQSTTRLRGSYSPQGPIVVESTAEPVALRSLDFYAEFGKIVGGTNAGPFDTVLYNSDDRWMVTSPTDVILDGELRLDATIVPPRPTNGVTMSGVMNDGNLSYSFEMERRQRLSADVSRPHNGGPVTIRSFSAFDKVEVNAQAGTLVGGMMAGPFESVVENSTSRWSAASESPVEFTWQTATSWRPAIDPPELDVVVPRTGVATVTLSNGPDSITVDVLRDAPEPGGLIGGYSMFGGPVLLSTTDGPQRIDSLSIHAMDEKGQLVGTDNPGPFERVVTNQADQWSVESTAPVTLDGVLQLDLEVERNAFLKGVSHNGLDTHRVVFNGFTDRVLEHNYVFPAYPEQGGNMLLLSANGSHGIAGLDFVSNEDGVLSQGADPSPFTFFLTPPDARQVTFGSLGTFVEVDDLIELDVFVSPGPASRFDGAAGGGGTPVLLPIVAMPHIEAPTCIVPQPETVGDLDGNGTVEFADFLTLAANYGQEVDTYAEGDTNCNGVVDFDDFLRMGNNFGGSTPKEAVANVPEPCSISWLLAMLLTLGRLVHSRPAVRIARNN